LDAVDDRHGEQRQCNISSRSDGRGGISHCHDLAFVNAVVAHGTVVRKLGNASKVAALEYGEEQVGSAHERRRRKDGVYDISLPLARYDPEKED
jgi:hypothetical protein